MIQYRLVQAHTSYSNTVVGQERKIRRLQFVVITHSCLFFLLLCGVLVDCRSLACVAGRLPLYMGFIWVFGLVPCCSVGCLFVFLSCSIHFCVRCLGSYAHVYAIPWRHRRRRLLSVRGACAVSSKVHAIAANDLCVSP